MPTTEKIEVKPRSEEIADPKCSYTTSQYGVWRLLIAKPTRKLFGEFWRDAFAGTELFRVFFADIYQIAPGLFLCVILTRFWSGARTSMTLYTSNRLLTIIEASVISGQANVHAIVIAAAVHMLCMMIASAMEWWADQIKPRMKHKVKNHFEGLLFRANLAKDLPTSQENSSKVRVSPDDAWQAFDDGIDLSTDYGGPIFVACCVAMPLFDIFVQPNLWTQSFVAHANNEHYLRLQALGELGEEQYRQDVISGNVFGYIVDEYEKARKALGDVSDDHPYYQFARRNNPHWNIFSGVLDELPMVYYAANAILSPRSFSVSSIAILQQTSTTLRLSFCRILYEGKGISEHVQKIESIYDAFKIMNQIDDGDLPYPSADTKGDGMALEVRNLCFEYPGNKSTKKALSDVSFSVKSGQLVVVVGANGSGKSTLVKILNRLYNPTSGEILVDGLAMSSYKISDLRQATADLSQDHTIYPLSIRENIGLGHPASVADIDMVRHSAELGGAFGFVSKFEEGFNTTLHPISTAMMGHAGAVDRNALKELLDSLEKQIDISGGEKQRLIASRTFMRLHSDSIRCCTVDEPSSALDPQGEMELFQRLRDAKGGKTMFFVTHRFGHLTKHADLIICMKDGRVAEMGTHTELMSKAAEYAKLYNVQADAFSSDVGSIPPAEFPLGRA